MWAAFFFGCIMMTKIPFPDPTEKHMSKKFFVLYDGRARTGSPDGCAAFDTATSEPLAHQKSRQWKDYDAIWYEYDVQGENDMTNERARPDIGRGVLLAA